jgi:hypothetical protein
MITLFTITCMLTFLIGSACQGEPEGGAVWDKNDKE